MCELDEEVRRYNCDVVKELWPLASFSSAGIAVELNDAEGSNTYDAAYVEMLASQMGLPSKGDLSREISPRILARQSAVKRLWGRISATEIARQIGCHPSTVQSDATALGLKTEIKKHERITWTPVLEQRLTRLWSREPSLPLVSIAAELGGIVSYYSVSKKAKALGLPSRHGQKRRQAQFELPLS